GKEMWNPAKWISGTVGWSRLAEILGWWNGPMSEWGPLGPEGPLSETAYCHTLPLLGDNSGLTFSKQLQAGGLWTVLGPAGPLGPLGPLGPWDPPAHTATGGTPTPASTSTMPVTSST